MPNKYDVESDVDTIAKFGYKPTKKTYKGSNPAGVPVYSRSITRTPNSKVTQSVRYAGSEGQYFKGKRKETYSSGRTVSEKFSGEKPQSVSVNQVRNSVTLNGIKKRMMQ